MEVVREGLPVGEAVLLVGLDVLVGEEVTSPVHGRANSVDSSSKLLGVAHIAPTLHNINLSTGGPLSIVIMDW